MAFNDPIAELLTKIRNAKDAEHKYVDINLSKEKLSIIKILKDQGFIESYLVNEKQKKVRIFLKYSQGRKSIIQGLKRVSKPGLKKYVGYKDIPQILNGMGIIFTDLMN